MEAIHKENWKESLTERERDREGYVTVKRKFKNMFTSKIDSFCDHGHL